jgi:hypothetical protein
VRRVPLGRDGEHPWQDATHLPHRGRPAVGASPGASSQADPMTESEVRHAAFRLEHTVRWNPHAPLVRSIRIDPPVTLLEARRMVEAELPGLIRAGVWSLMDGAQLVRGGDIVAVRVVPVGSVAEDDHGIGFGLTAVQGE